MCYSAMVNASISKLKRRYNAQVEFQQIERTFRRRIQDPKFYKIPKAFESNFDEPNTPEEKRIKALIDEYRDMIAKEIGAELFKQKTRLVEAKRDITEHEESNKTPTKRSLNDRRVAADKVEDLRERLSDLRRTEPKARDGRIFPRHFAPIIIKENGVNKIVLARYLLRRRGLPPSWDDQYSGCYNARLDNSTKFWKHEFGKTHAMCEIESFYENVEGPDGKNKVLHFTPDTGREMRIACLYSLWGDPEKDGFHSFAAMTGEPPEEIRSAGHDRCVINLEEDVIEEWLAPDGKSNEQLLAVLERKERPYYGHQIVKAA